MSEIHCNDVWLESANENFEQAMLEGNLDFAQAVVDDCRDAGFKDQAALMGAQLERQKKASRGIDISGIDEVVAFMGKVNEAVYGVNPFKHHEA